MPEGNPLGYLMPYFNQENTEQRNTQSQYAVPAAYTALQQQLQQRQAPTEGGHKYSDESAIILAALGNLSSALTSKDPGEEFLKTAQLLQGIQNNRTKQAFQDFELETKLLESQLDASREEILLRGQMKELFNREIAHRVGLKKTVADAEVAEQTVDSRIRQEKAKATQEEAKVARIPQEDLKAQLENAVADQTYRKMEQENSSNLQILQMAGQILDDPKSSIQDKLRAVGWVQQRNAEQPKTMSTLDQAALVSPEVALLREHGIQNLEPEQFQHLLAAVNSTELTIFPKPVRDKVTRVLGKLSTMITKKESGSEQTGFDFAVDSFSDPLFRSNIKGSEMNQEFRELIKDIQENQMPSVKGDLLQKINELYLLKIKAMNENIPIEMILDKEKEKDKKKKQTEQDLATESLNKLILQRSKNLAGKIK